MIVLDNLTKRFGPKVLFENVSMQFDPGKRYGLTGANGAGKSTLLKMLSGFEDSDTGSISIPGNLRLGVLKQNHFEYDKERILDTVLMGNKALWDALQEKERLLAGEVTDEIGIRLGELEGTIAEEDGYSAESEAGELLVGLGIPAEKQAEAMGSLAAGYKLRVLLAQVLFGHPDVLLLDEPTNHLDLESIRWLESFLIDDFKGTLVVVSHDRHFLNAAATHIADVDYKTVTVYTGAYDDFIAQKYENKQRADATAGAAKKKKEELQEFVQRFGSHASKSKQAQSRLKQIEKLEDVIETKASKRSSLVRPFIRFDFEKPSGRDVVRMEAVSKAFGPKVIYRDLNLNVNRGDKIAIIGPNGIGKSTLLKLMVGGFQGLDEDTKKETLQPDPPAKGKDGESARSAARSAPETKPEVRWGHDTSVGYFAQDHHEALGHTSKGTTAFQWLYGWDTKRPQEEIRSILGRLLFQGDQALKPVEALSGGESARLLLCKLLLLQHNVLVLDEPTNHLDIESIEGLLDGLKMFKGTVVFVSHDRHFVSELSNRVIELMPGKDASGTPCTALTDFSGSYEEYLERSGRDYMRK